MADDLSIRIMTLETKIIENDIRFQAIESILAERGITISSDELDDRIRLITTNRFLK